MLYEKLIDSINIRLIGLMATLVGIISFIPVIRVVHKKHITKNFPFKSLALAMLSNLLWIGYGIGKEPKDLVVLTMGLLYMAMYSFILFVKMSY